MVVRVGVTTGRHARRDYWSLLRVTVLLAGIAVLPAPTRSAGSSPIGSSAIIGSAIGFTNPASPFAFGMSAAGLMRQAPVSDPTAAALSSMTSLGTVSVIAPMVLDPATSTMLDVPGGGSAEEFGVGSGAADVASSGGVDGLSGGVPTISGAGWLPTVSTAQGIKSLCSYSQMEKQLQAGGEFWNAQGVSAKPVQFPPDVFTGMDAKNPLGLDPSGNSSNLSPPPPGPAGGWCRPPPGPFAQSSPLESVFLWIAIGSMLVGVVVFLLSRGIKLPTERELAS